MSLHELQTTVHVAKDKVNSFGGYNYRTAEGILAAIKAALPVSSTIVVSDELREVAGQIFVQATATVRFADGTEHSALGFAMHPLTKKGMDPSQITGSASSYARKYALAGLVAIDDGSADPDGAKEEYKPAPKPEMTDAEKRDKMKEAIFKIANPSGLKTMWKSDRVVNGVASLPQLMQSELQVAYDDRAAELS